MRAGHRFLLLARFELLVEYVVQRRHVLRLLLRQRQHAVVLLLPQLI